jgi:diguanylate cyclase (GGDEF)-like protein
MRMLETANERATFLAAYDLLTGLPNRRLFQDKLEQALAEALRDGSRVGVFYVDLDHFTTINDLLGNAAGDTALQAVAERLRGCLRAGDTLARLGGDEFGVIQSIINRSEHADILGQRLVAAMAPPIDIDGQPHHVGISVGVAVSDIVLPNPADQLMRT